MEVILKKYDKRICSNLLCFCAALSLFCTSIFSVSCKMTAEGVVAASDDVHNPILTEFSQNSADGVVLSFTERVKLSNLEVRSNTPSAMGGLVFSETQLKVTEQVIDKKTMLPDSEDKDEQWQTIQIDFINADELEPGAAYILSGLAHDDEGNSLLFQVPFHGFNDNVAGLVLSEVRTEAADTKTEKAKIEFVELYVHTPGNLAGISLTSVNDENKFGEYVFPSTEVAAGEYIAVHFRTMEGHREGCIDETDSNLNASTAPDSCAEARDFWVPGTDARLGKSDIIILQQRSGGPVVDALLYAQSDISETALKKLVPAAQTVIDSGAWIGTEDISTWVSGDGLTTPNRTLSRQNIAEIDLAAETDLSIPVASNEHWFVTTTVKPKNGATPGLPNSTNKYTK